MQVTWHSNTISVRGNVTADCIFGFTQGVYVAAIKQGYKDLVLDFSDTQSVFESFMVPIIAQCRNYMLGGTEFVVIPPKDGKLRALFHNANWLFLLNPRDYVASDFSGYQHVPASSYVSPQDQHKVVNEVMDVIVGNLQVRRRQLAALEWCINEITDNVINHAESALGGLVQASTFPARNSVEFVVADAGVGVRATLGGRTDSEALSRAIQEGVTRNNKTNQGNGLYGSFRVSALSGGHFQMHSGRSSLICRGLNDVRTRQQSTALFPGTVVTSQIICSDERLIEQALTFKGRLHEPAFDYIEQAFESPADPNNLRIRMRDEAGGFGSRDSGRVVRNKLLNMLRSSANNLIEVDFDDVMIVSSSFADEAFGKVFLELGPLQFMRRIKFINIDKTIHALVDRAILLRSGQMTLDRDD